MRAGDRSLKDTIRKTTLAALSLLGFLLSPISWWNDVWINLPLAWLVAGGVAYFHHAWYTPAFVLAYWITNLLGLLLMHFGLTGLTRHQRQPITYKTIVQGLLVSMAYTLIIVALCLTGILQQPWHKPAL